MIVTVSSVGVSVSVSNGVVVGVSVSSVSVDGWSPHAVSSTSEK